MKKQINRQKMDVCPQRAFQHPCNTSQIIRTIMDTGFVDAMQRHKEFPHTFQVPRKAELNKLKPGQLVKVCHNGERFWTIIKTIDGKSITATVDNALVMEQPFQFGDVISFEKRHIFDIWDD